MRNHPPLETLLPQARIATRSAIAFFALSSHLSHLKICNLGHGMFLPPALASVRPGTFRSRLWPFHEQRARRHLRTHSKETSMAIGTVKFFNMAKGFGFIQPEDGSRDVFVHITALQAAGLTTLREGQRVAFEITTERGKSAATNLKLA
jgi:CspA family cold shock protein